MDFDTNCEPVGIHGEVRNSVTREPLSSLPEGIAYDSKTCSMCGQPSLFLFRWGEEGKVTERGSCGTLADAVDVVRNEYWWTFEGPNEILHARSGEIMGNLLGKQLGRISKAFYERKERSALLEETKKLFSSLIDTHAPRQQTLFED